MQKNLQLSESISDFNKVIGYIINIQKNQIFKHQLLKHKQKNPKKSQYNLKWHQ